MHPRNQLKTITILTISLGLLSAGLAPGQESAQESDQIEEQEIDGQRVYVEEIEIYSASRRAERIVEAPAAVSVITAEQIAREAAHGQLPKLLELAPGAEITQNGLYDFNFNSRGFNSSFNRRVLTLVDGRDVSAVFIGNQDWATSLAGAPDLLAKIELVRGPGSALYGSDAYNGVLNMMTRAPSAIDGGRLRLTIGELDTIGLDVLHAAELGGGWFLRATGRYLESDDFSRSRIDLNGDGVADIGSEVEYQGLDLEGIPLLSERNQIGSGNLRLDKQFDHAGSLELELASSSYDPGGTQVSGVGRTQSVDSRRSYARVSYSHPHWRAQSTYDEREIGLVILGNGFRGPLVSRRFDTEVQGNTGFAAGRGRLVGGLSYREEESDSTNEEGVQTAMFARVNADYEGLFGQVEYDLTTKLRSVFSIRWDDSNTHPEQVSPRAALIFSPSSQHSLRVSYGQGFQAPSLTDLNLQINIAPPLTALAGLEAAFCAPFGVACGLDAIPVKALGNPDLTVEEIEAVEIGYSGIINDRMFLTIDLYRNELQNFVTALLPAFNPTLGILNPSFGPYQAPAGIPGAIAPILEATLRAAIPTISNDPVTGLALLKAITYTNFGEVETQGIELGLSGRLSEAWSFELSGNWFDFDVQGQLDQDPLIANAPEFQFALGLLYQAERFSASARYRHVDGFDWAAGAFAGPIPSYDLLAMTASYRFSQQLDVELEVSNLTDDEHYQIFGGDLIGRRALASLVVRW